MYARSLLPLLIWLSAAITCHVFSRSLLVGPIYRARVARFGAIKISVLQT